MKTAGAAPFWHLPVPGGTARWRMQAVWWLVWPKLFGPGARAIEGWTPSGHTRLLSASRLTVAPSHCMHSQQSGQQGATLLRSSSGSAGAGRQAVLTAVICFGLCASEEWGFAYMLRSGSKLVSACNLTLPLVAACSCACVLRAFPAGIARLRDRIRRLRATCISKEDQQIMQSMIIRPKHISVRNPQAPGPRSRSALCSRRRRYDARIPPIFADHLRSSVLCIQCRQARGGIPLVAISVRACMPGQRISLREWGRMGYWYRFFNFDLPEGSQGNTEADWRQWRQTRFGHARSERRRPQFTAHNSVRPLKNGLSLGGSSATRPPIHP